MRKLALIVCTLFLAGCASSPAQESSGGVSESATDPAPSSTGSPSVRADLEVSDAATCQTLIGTDGGLVSETGQFLIDVSELSDTTVSDATALADALDGVSQTASEKFRNLLTIMQEPFRDLEGAYKNGETFTLKPSRFKAAGNEVIALCEPLLASSSGNSLGETLGNTEAEMPAPSVTDTAQPEATPPADGGTYSSIVDLQRAYVKAGGDCSLLDQANQISLAAESGNCNDTTVISTYLSRDDISTLIQNNKELTADLEVERNDVWLIGQNWVINSDDATEIQKEMGGQLVSF